MILVYSNIVQINLLEDVSQSEDFKTSFRYTINKLIKAILVPIKQLLKFYNVVSIDELYFEMLTLFILYIIGVSAHEALHKGT